MAQARTAGTPVMASAAERILDMAQRAWASYWAYRAQLAAVAMLHSLDDRALKDIGLDRSEIESVVHAGREHGKPAAIDRARSAERRIGMCA